MANTKTNAMRILDKAKITYQMHTYEHGDEAIDGLSVARITHQDPAKVFKTLITMSKSHQYYVFMIPVASELDLKAAASSVHEKSVEMIPAKDINKISGYIRGGCSPLGMKKLYKTIIDASAQNYDTILCSGGKIGLQIEVNPDDLLKVIHGEYGMISRSN